MIDAKTIKPKVRGHSDFFSWQFYRWVKANPHYQEVWRGTWNSATGIDPTRPTLYIGEMHSDGWFIGRQLTNLCTFRSGSGSLAYNSAFDLANWVNITDEFWVDYMRRGVCAIHEGLVHKWDEQGDSRTCEYCGASEIRTTKTEVVRREVWVAARRLDNGDI